MVTAVRPCLRSELQTTEVSGITGKLLKSIVILALCRGGKAPLNIFGGAVALLAPPLPLQVQNMKMTHHLTSLSADYSCIITITFVTQ